MPHPQRQQQQQQHVQPMRALQGHTGRQPAAGAGAGGSNQQPPHTRFTSLKQFYPYYRREHSQTGTRVLHVLGTGLFLAQAAAAALTRTPQLLLRGVVSAYGCAWVGHFFVEHNRPATFRYPLYSLASDFIMLFNILTGREPLRGSVAA